LLHPVEVGHLVEHAVAAALGAGSVVSVNEEDQGVIQFTGLLDGVDHSANLVVGHLDEGREHLGLPGEQLLLVSAQAVPVWDCLWLGREPGALGHHAALDLPRQNLLAQRVPTLIKPALPARDPLLGHVVRGMCARAKPRGRRRASAPLVPDTHRLVGHVDEKS
jgi:hypothetical protein